MKRFAFAALGLVLAVFALGACKVKEAGTDSAHFLITCGLGIGAWRAFGAARRAANAAAAADR